MSPLRVMMLAAALTAACSDSATTFNPPADAAVDAVSADAVSADAVSADAASDVTRGDVVTLDATADAADAVAADARDVTSADAIAVDVAADRVQPDVVTRDAGPTGATCGGRGTPPCADGMFCNFPPSSICGRADGPGTCEAPPDLCPAIVDPVCGCDGTTYNNACDANRHSVSVDHTGACVDDTAVDAGSADCRTTGCPTGQSCMGCRGPSGGVYVCIPAGAVC